MAFREALIPSELIQDEASAIATEKLLPKILTICMGGKDRSRVIAEELQKRGYDSWYRGIRSFTNRLTQEDIDQADHIIVVGDRVLEEIESKFSLVGKKVDFLPLVESVHSSIIRRGGEDEEEVRELVRQDLDLLDLIELSENEEKELPVVA